MIQPVCPWVWRRVLRKALAAATAVAAMPVVAAAIVAPMGAVATAAIAATPSATVASTAPSAATAAPTARAPRPDQIAGIEVVPVLQAAGTDAIYLAESGIPTYGISGMFIDPDLSNVHGLNERIRVQPLYDGRDFLFSLVKLYAEQVR
jgi:acetylornithine deacetylase/succinyl-diaminopimelate desuccinylase-like protein